MEMRNASDALTKHLVRPQDDPQSLPLGDNGDSPSCNPLLEAAITYVRRGWPVLPIHGIVNSSCTCGKPSCTHPGKHPLTQHGLKDASTQERRVRDWLQNWPDANIAIVTGDRSGLLVLDVDGSEGRSSIAGKHLPETPCTTTGRGSHYYFQRPVWRAVPNKTRILPGADVRGDGSYVVAPPSVHRNGVVYRWGVGPEEELSSPPAWLMEFLHDKAPEGQNGVTTLPSPEGHPIHRGTRNVDLTRIAGAMRRVGCGYNEVLAALRVANEQRCTPPLGVHEVEGIVSSIMRYLPGQRTGADIVVNPIVRQYMTIREAEHSHSYSVKLAHIAGTDVAIVADYFVTCCGLFGDGGTSFTRSKRNIREATGLKDRALETAILHCQALEIIEGPWVGPFEVDGCKHGNVTHWKLDVPRLLNWLEIPLADAQPAAKKLIGELGSRCVNGPMTKPKERLDLSGSGNGIPHHHWHTAYEPTSTPCRNRLGHGA